MSEKLSGPKASDQLSLPIEWWQSFANDPETVRLETDVDTIVKESEKVLCDEEAYDAKKLEIRRLHLELAQRALNFYGVKKVENVNHFDNGYGFDFNYDGYHVNTNWYNHKSLSIKTWDRDMKKRDREMVWKIYEDELRSWNDAQITGRPCANSQEDRLYDPLLRDLCMEYGFRRFTLRTSSHKPHIRTRHVLPAALHLIDMPITHGYPILGPGQGDIEVIEPGKIISRRERRDKVWVINDQGIFVESNN